MRYNFETFCWMGAILGAFALVALIVYADNKERKQRMALCLQQEKYIDCHNVIYKRDR